jgi:hypothetical protein
MTTNQLEMNFAPKSVPSISSSAMLVDLSISLWSARKLDKRASEEVATTNNADKGVARVTKSLLGNCDELDALVKFGANVRNMHYNSTLPWSDMGPRLLPTTKYFNYQRTFTALEAEFNRMVQAFLDAYDLEVAQAQAKLGDLFDVNEYPSVEQLRAKFSFRINYIPLPDAGDWRLDIANEALASLQTQYTAHYENQLAGAMRDIWERLHGVLTTLSRQLSDSTTNAKGEQITPKIYTSVFDRALEVIDLMETCNITGDVNMQLMQRRLANAFKGVTVEAVKDDAYLRRETKQAIDAAIKNLPSLDF